MDANVAEYVQPPQSLLVSRGHFFVTSRGITHVECGRLLCLLPGGMKVIGQLWMDVNNLC
jgi:hypothetical protein